MIDDTIVEQVLHTWLKDGSDRLPDRVAAGVLDRLPATPQHRNRWSHLGWRVGPRAWAAAIVVVLAVAIAIPLLPRLGGSGIVGGPTPVQSAATPSPTPLSPLPSATIRPAGIMDPGTYRMEAPFEAPFSITFPTSWIARSVGSRNAEFLKADSIDGGAAWVSVHLIDGVFVDPCHPDAGLVQPAPTTVEMAVSAISAMKDFDAGPVTDALVGGLPAKTFTVTNSIDTETAGCTDGPMLPLWTFGGAHAATNGGGTEHLWVLEVHGSIVIIDGESFSATPAAALEETTAVVESIVFE